jgi:putative ABC transport system permease protein
MMNTILYRIALRNLVRRARKNVVVAALIAVGVAAFFVGNAVLESSIGGIQRTFSDNFTADLSISEKSEQSFSLFGPDIPVIGEYESEPVILNAEKIGATAAKVPGVSKVAYVLSSPLLVEAGGARDGGLGLGVIGEEYFSLFSRVRFIAGGPPGADSTGWAVITEEWAKKIETAQGHAVRPGDKIQLSFFHNQTFTIRGATVAGVIRYAPTNDALAKIVVVDGRILRALIGYSQSDAATPGAGSGGQPAAGGSTDVDALFSDSEEAAPAPADGSAPVSIMELQKLMQEARTAGAQADVSPLGHNGAWHFILVRTDPAADRGRVATALREALRKDDASALVRDWRGTAGAVALYVYLMQFVLFIGLFMVGGIVLILTINSLVMSVFERTGEIGTMRAIGARPGFIRGLFILETSVLTLLSAAGGILLGAALVGVLDGIGLRFNNQLLVLLFGGNALHPDISGGNILLSVVAAAVLGTVAWVYPVRLALRIPPIKAIQTV